MAGEIKQEDKLQAVLLVDSYAKRLRPASFDGPKALMPLCGAPLINYSLEALASSGMEEVFVFCRHGYDAVAAYVDAVAARFAPTVIQCIRGRTPCYSAGDALRQIFDAEIIQGDFLLMAGDVVTNISLRALIRAHKEAVARDKSVLMTITATALPMDHRARPAEEEAMWVIDADGRLRHYQALPGGLAAGATPGRVPRVQIPLENVLTGPDAATSVEVRTDLVDAMIDVCSKDLLAHLADNFDWQDLRRDLLTQLVAGGDLFGQKIHVYEPEPATAGTAPYFGRPTDWRTYGEVTADVLMRWSFPLVPDSGLLGSVDWADPEARRASFRVGRGCVYREGTPQLARTCTLGQRVLLGEGTVVSAETRVARSVLGRRCVVDAGATVTDSVLWAEVHVGAGAKVHGAVLCDGVRVGAGAMIHPGCVVGGGAIVGPGATIPPRTLLTTRAARAVALAAPGAGDPAGAPAEEPNPAFERWAEAEDDDVDDDDFGDDDDGSADAPEQAVSYARCVGPEGEGFHAGTVAPCFAFASALGAGAVWTESAHSDDDEEEGGDETVATSFHALALETLRSMFAAGCALTAVAQVARASHPAVPSQTRIGACAARAQQPQDVAQPVRG